MDLSDIQFFLLLLAFFASLLSTLAGGGSGLLLVPVLLFMGIPFSSAVAINKITTVAQGGGAIIKHLNGSTINWKIGLLILFSGVPGVVFGSMLIPYVNSRVAELTLGILILTIAIFSIVLPIKKTNNSNLTLTIRNTSLIAAGIFIVGVINGAFTASSGLFLTFWLVIALKFDFNKAISHTVIFCTFFWNIIGGISMYETVIAQWHLLPVLLFGSLMGGYVGAYISVRISADVSQNIFVSISFIISLFLIF